MCPTASLPCIKRVYFALWPVPFSDTSLSNRTFSVSMSESCSSTLPYPLGYVLRPLLYSLSMPYLWGGPIKFRAFQNHISTLQLHFSTPELFPMSQSCTSNSCQIFLLGWPITTCNSAWPRSNALSFHPTLLSLHAIHFY